MAPAVLRVGSLDGDGGDVDRDRERQPESEQEGEADHSIASSGGPRRRAASTASPCEWPGSADADNRPSTGGGSWRHPSDCGHRAVVLQKAFADELEAGKAQLKARIIAKYYDEDQP
jgi:hypothetical protein